MGHRECTNYGSMGNSIYRDINQKTKYAQPAIGLLWQSGYVAEIIRPFVHADVGPAFLITAYGQFYRYNNAIPIFYYSDNLETVLHPMRMRISVAGGFEVGPLQAGLRYGTFLSNGFKHESRPRNFSGTRFGNITAYMSLNFGFGGRYSNASDHEEPTKE